MDGWAGYLHLNELGFEHYTVYHRYEFVTEYLRPDGTIERAHTNTIEGAWRHARLHFSKMSGTTVTQFEGHLCEIMWRNAHSNSNKYNNFFKLINMAYPLHQDPLPIPHKVFDTWTVAPKDCVTPCQVTIQASACQNIRHLQ
jgi:hypothetical protein